MKNTSLAQAQIFVAFWIFAAVYNVYTAFGRDENGEVNKDARTYVLYALLSGALAYLTYTHFVARGSEIVPGKSLSVPDTILWGLGLCCSFCPCLLCHLWVLFSP
jgi:hypothetical protein